MPSIFDRFRPTPKPAPSTLPNQTPPPEKTVDVQAPSAVEPATSAKAAQQAADTLIRVVTEHKDRDGKMGMEGWGKGDPNVTERRSAVATLIADKNGAVVDEAKLRAISAEIAKDIDFIKDADARDYTLDGPGQFEWYRPYNNNTVTDRILQQEFDDRVKKQKHAVDDLVAGKSKFMDVSTMSVVGLGLIPDGRLRDDAMMDALLQFRARTDKANQKEDGWVTRIDRYGAALIAEQNVLLGTMPLSAGDAQSGRDYALLREVIASHPVSSTNSIYEARNAVAAFLTDQGRSADRMSSTNSPTAWIWKETPPGASASPYSSIHHNFSRDTPNNIRAFIEEWMYPAGPRATRPIMFTGLVNVMSLARKGDGANAAKLLVHLFHMSAVMDPTMKLVTQHLQELADEAHDGIGDDVADAHELADAIRDYLVSVCTKNLGVNVEKNLEMAARTYTSVCLAQPNESTLAHDLFRAGPAYTEVADVIAAMTANNDRQVLRELGEARLAMKDAIFAAKSGYDRREMIKLDAQLVRITNEQLGGAVESVGTLQTDKQKSTCLLALQTALRSTVASGLQDLRSDRDQSAAPAGQLEQALADVDAALAKGKVTETEYRKLMSNAYVAVRGVVQNIRAFADERAAAVATGGAEIDPEFIDQFIKQSPLHYATALAEKGLRVGLHETIGAREIENVDGMRVLNGIGPVVFTSVVTAENGKDLAAMGTSKDQLAILYHLEEKKMVAVGGLFVDTAQAPGGNSHLNMYAMNNGIPVVALPDLRTKYATFFANAQKEGGVYVDDSGDGFKMMTLARARELGLVGPTQEDLDKLRPGVNRKITYLKPTADGESFEVAAKHDAIINAQRKTREVELYVPEDEVKGVGHGVPTFDELATLGVRARHLAGEKGTVLALLSKHPVLSQYVPKGSEITPGDIRDLLRGAKLLDGRTLEQAWDDVWNNDPKVGVVDDRNFLKSEFYTNPRYRKRTREALQEQTRTALTKSLIDSSTSPPKLTEAGAALYANVMRNGALSEAETGSIIFRSSFTGEDRPGKSGAGQYESYVDRSIANEMYGKDVVDAAFAKLNAAMATKDAAQIAKAREEHNAFMGPARVKAAIGVVESTWMPEPIENNAAEQFFLKHIGPTVVVQSCMTPDISGVMISRNVDNGARNQVTFQLVKGFGGGVDGGKATEGVIKQGGADVKMIDGAVADGADAGVTVGGVQVSSADMQKLREIVLETERFFNDVVEPGKGHAVDMEVARQNGEWRIVQARVLLMDK